MKLIEFKEYDNLNGGKSLNKKKNNSTDNCIYFNIYINNIFCNIHV